MAAGNFEKQGKALVIFITRLVQYQFREYIEYSWESPMGLHSPCYLLAFPTDCPSAVATNLVE